MKDDLDKALVRDFPLLFADRNGPMTHTSMCWGFPGDGWEPLIRRLAEGLEPLIAAFPPESRPRAVQVKEKFGTLRFYMTGQTDEMAKLIRVAENESARTCEDCGAPGRTRGGGWIVTLCDRCASTS